MKNPNDTIRNRIPDLPGCSTVPQCERICNTETSLEFTAQRTAIQKQYKYVRVLWAVYSKICGTSSTNTLNDTEVCDERWIDHSNSETHILSQGTIINNHRCTGNKG
jgi:hypothetical protein